MSARPLPPDVREVAELLSRERPQATPLELDRSKLRATRAAVHQPAFAGAPKGTVLASRLLITVLLTLGIFTSGAGATLAISGISGSGGDARFAQYESNDDNGNNNNNNNDNNDNAGDVQGSSGGNDQGQPPPGGIPDEGGVAGVGTPTLGPAVGNGSGPNLRAAAQEESEDKRQGLPMTGLAAVPVLLAGMLMLGTGLVLRRRAVD